LSDRIRTRVAKAYGKYELNVPEDNSPSAIEKLKSLEFRFVYPASEHLLRNELQDFFPMITFAELKLSFVEDLVEFIEFVLWSQCDEQQRYSTQFAK
jgi:hypothetical protein